MTPAEWENMFTVAHGGFDSAFDRVKQTLLSMKPHERFAAYADYGLERVYDGDSEQRMTGRAHRSPASWICRDVATGDVGCLWLGMARTGESRSETRDYEARV
jgi:hypothetical protein